MEQLRGCINCGIYSKQDAHRSSRAFAFDSPFYFKSLFVLHAAIADVIAGLDTRAIIMCAAIMSRPHVRCLMTSARKRARGSLFIPLFIYLFYCMLKCISACIYIYIYIYI